jgi:hypothetical protein
MEVGPAIMLNKIKGHHLLLIAAVIIVIYLMARNASIRTNLLSNKWWPGVAPEIGDGSMIGGRYEGD